MLQNDRQTLEYQNFRPCAWVNMSPFPSYDDLRIIEVNGQKKRYAWGLFDKDGQKDVLGCINKVTPEIMAKAASEVTDGVSISLK